MNLTPTQPLLVVGTGAMACLIAGRLSSAGVPVRVLGNWSAGLQALQQYGVRIHNAGDLEQAFPVQVTHNPMECIGARYALVLVKSWQTGRVAGKLASILAPDGLALTLQNGTNNRELLTQALGAGRVALGVTPLSADLLEPGRVQPAGEAIISLGAHPNLAPLAGWLRQAGFIIENAPDANALLWGKLVINAAIHSISALLGAENGELLRRGPARMLLQSAAREAAAVAVAQGIRLPYPDPVVATETIARTTAVNRSPMLQDMQRQAPTEIDVISGAIVRAADQLGIPAPIHRTLWQLISARVAGYEN
jgi:2-dehydropantoate 2-reductase